MKKIRILSFLLLICIVLSTLCACEWFGQKGPGEFVDYADQLKFDPNSGRIWQEVTVHILVDGDTTHFNVPKNISDTGILKARYLAINTPESTGAIEEWGKTASEFTKSKLSQEGIEIIVESDTSTWNLDSTGGRHLVWVWYKTPAMADYRNLNLEILQNGLAVASNAANNSYGDICMKAIEQAEAHKLYVHSDEKDPTFHYGAGYQVTIAEVATNYEKYNGAKIICEGVITKYDGESFYIEEYDPETGMYYGLTVYPGYNLNVFGQKITKVGNRIKLVGVVTYYETGGYYQVSDLTYSAMMPDHEDNIQLISEGHSPAYTVITGEQFVNGKVTVIDSEDVAKEYKFAQLALNTSVQLNGLKVIDAYTTNNGGNNDGAISLTCLTADGHRITVRTAVLKDSNGNLVTEDYYMGKTIDVKGIINYYDGNYQIKLLSLNDVTISE